MEERGISEEEAEETLRHPDLEFSGKVGRIVAERVPPGRRLALRVVYNHGLEDERIVVTVELGRPTTNPPKGADA